MFPWGLNEIESAWLRDLSNHSFKRVKGKRKVWEGCYFPCPPCEEVETKRLQGAWSPLPPCVGWSPGSLSSSPSHRTPLWTDLPRSSLVPLKLWELADLVMAQLSVLPEQPDFHLSIWPEVKTESSDRKLGTRSGQSFCLIRGFHNEIKALLCTPAPLNVCMIWWLPLKTHPIFCFSQHREPDKSDRVLKELCAHTAAGGTRPGCSVLSVLHSDTPPSAVFIDDYICHIPGDGRICSATTSLFIIYMQFKSMAQLNANSREKSLFMYRSNWTFVISPVI